MATTLVFAADHGGYELKNELVEYAKGLEGVEVEDLGVNTADRVDYPDQAEKACRRALAVGASARAVLVCGSGVGISIAANKIAGVRCALVSEEYSARMARRHNDANALALGGRVLGAEVAKGILSAFISADFEGGRHADRVEKIRLLQKL